MNTTKHLHPAFAEFLANMNAVIIGFDSEFVAPEIIENPKWRNKTELKGLIERAWRKNDVVSYQAHVISPQGSYPWIELMPQGHRMKLAKFIESVIRKGMRKKILKKFPKKILLAAHWSIPDLTSLEDYDKFKNLIDGVGRTQASMDSGFEINIYDESRNRKPVLIKLYDTTLLAPENARKLGNLGELLGVEKVELPEGAIEDMRQFSMDDPSLFQRYAIMDARIAAEWLCFCSRFNHELLGDVTPPSTLGSIAVNFTLRRWEEGGVDRMEMIGVRKATRRDHSTFEKLHIVRSTFEQLAADAFYGGRNESFFYGASPIGMWYDFDLNGAYVTALMMIGMPDWDRTGPVTCIEDLSHESFSAAHIEFSFPEDIRFPCLPVRTDNALLFPLQGTTVATGTEIALALSLGAKISLLHGMGYVIPKKTGLSPFALISKYITDKRAELVAAGRRGSPEEMMHKTIGNSVYGKISQGLKNKRVFDPKSGETKPVGPSRITNPFIAAEVTALIRAVMAEILNNLPEGYNVLSVTTDGFITDAPPEVVEEAAVKGALGKLFLAARGSLVPEATSYLELKHQARQVLVWRTRGQATLEEGEGENGVLLAKAGLSVPDSRKHDPNDYIVEKFINRHDEDLKDPVERFRSLHEIYKSGGRYDLNKRLLWITTTMEYDWKRLRSCAPGSMGMRSIRGVDHVYFDTRPLPSAESYDFVRSRWASFVKKRAASKSVLMTTDDVKSFESYLSISPAKGVVAKRGAGSQSKVLVQMFLRAKVRGILGLTHDCGNSALVKLLDEAGVQVSVHDVENARRKGSNVVFECLYRTPELDELIDKLKSKFPTFDPSPLICSEKNPLGYDHERHARLGKEP